MEGGAGSGAATWRVEHLRASHNLTSLGSRQWARWLRALHVDGTFAAHMGPQRCADEIEPGYARCKAAVLCATSELGVARCAAGR